MKNKKTILKVLSTICIMVTMLFTYNLEIYAIDSIIQGADDFLSLNFKNGNSDEDSNKNVVVLNMDTIKETSNTIFNIFLAVGTSIVVIIGAILGLRFMMGSTTEKAEVKEALTPYVIGSAVIFGAITIWTIVGNLLIDIFKS